MENQLFKITQNAVIKDVSGRVLVLQHKTGKWLLPGGKIHKGETWLGGLQRELREETSLTDFQISRILDVDSWTEGDEGYYVVTYLIEVLGEFPIKLSEEHAEYAWISSQDLEKYDFWNPKIRERIRKAF